MQFRFKNKFDGGGKLSRTEKIKKIQDYLDIEITGKWNNETEKSYREKMKELNLSNIELAEKITGYKEEKKEKNTEIESPFKNLNQKGNENLPIIKETGLCGDSLAKGCSQYVTDKLSVLHGVSPSEFRSKVGADHAWNLFTRLQKEGKAVELTSKDELKIGDYVDLGRSRFSGKDQAYDEAQKQGKNPHIGIIIGKTKDGKPIVEHYIQGKGVRRDPIDNIKISDNSNTKYEPLRIYRQTVINKPAKQEKLSANFRKDSSFDFQEKESVKSDVQRWSESLRSFFKQPTSESSPVSERVLKGIENIANDVAKKFNLTDAELEKLARASYGIIGQESNFGTNLTADARRAIKRSVKSVLVDPFGTNKEERHNMVSRGYNQMKNTNLHYYDKNGNLKKTKAGELFENYDTDIPEDAGATTLAVLAENYEKFRNLYPNASPNDLLYRSLVAYNSGYTAAKKNKDLSTRDNFYANSVLKRSENVTSQNPQYDYLYKKIRQGTVQGDHTPVFGQAILSGQAFQKMNEGKFKLEKGGKICAKGVVWAKRTFDKYPSAYANMAASKYCKDPNYGKNRGKDSKKSGGKFEFSEGGKAGNQLKKWREENWTKSDGSPCGNSTAQKNPARCKPAAKWKTMSESEKKADNAKKKKEGAKGKQFVSATKKGKVTKEYTKRETGGKFYFYTGGGIPGLGSYQDLKTTSQNIKEKPLHLQPIDMNKYQSSPNYRAANQQAYNIQQGIKEGNIQVKQNQDGSFRYIASGKTEATDSPLDLAVDLGTGALAMKGVRYATKATSDIAKSEPVKKAVQAGKNLAENARYIGEPVEIIMAKPGGEKLAKELGKKAEDVAGAYRFDTEIVDSSGKLFKPGDVALESSTRVKMNPLEYALKGKKKVEKILQEIEDESAMIISPKNPLFGKKSVSVEEVGSLEEGAKKFGGASQVSGQPAKSLVGIDFSKKEGLTPSFRSLFQTPSKEKTSAALLYNPTLRSFGGLILNKFNFKNKR